MILPQNYQYYHKKHILGVKNVVWGGLYVVYMWFGVVWRWFGVFWGGLGCFHGPQILQLKAQYLAIVFYHYIFLCFKHYETDNKRSPAILS